MIKSKGFTLIEILIALVIFVIISAATTTTLYLVFSSREKVQEQSERLTEIEMALSVIERDISQFINRPIRHKQWHYLPAIYGDSQSLTFTRSGYLNPLSNAKQSNLERINYYVKQGSLYRQAWHQLDGAKSTPDSNQLILSGIAHINFSYLDNKLSTLNRLNNDALSQQSQLSNKGIIPKAIVVNVSLTDWGNINRLYIIASSLYGGGE